MKIAFLSSGHARNAHELIENTKNKLFSNINPDIYFYSYKDTDLNILKKSINFYYLYEINQDDDLKIDELFFKNKHPEVKVGNTFKMLKNKYNVFNLIKNDYDLYIYGRFDVNYINSLDIKVFKEIDENTIFIPRGGDHREGINDIFSVGKKTSMFKYCNVFNYLNEYVPKECLFHPELLLKTHLNKQKVNIKRFDFSINIRGQKYC